MTIEMTAMAHAQLKILLIAFSLLLLSPAAAIAELNNEGLHTETWFNETTGDLSKDLAAASAEDKTLVIFWEQQGCHFCQKIHEVNLKVEDTVHFIRKNFYVIMLNMRGERQMIDFDGTAMSVSKLARNHRVTGTPTIEFLDDHADEVFRMPGYAEPLIFHGVFDYVASSGFDDSPLIPWLKAKYLSKEQSGS